LLLEFQAEVLANFDQPVLGPIEQTAYDLYEDLYGFETPASETPGTEAGEP